MLNIKINININKCKNKKIHFCKHLKVKVKKHNADETLKSSLEKWYKLLYKNKGILAWFCPLIVALVAAFLKFLWFAMESGKVAFWNIDSSAISMSNNSIYNIVLLLVFAIIILAIMMIPTIIIKSKQKISAKLFQFFVLYILFFAICAVSVDGWIISGENIIISIIAFAIAVAFIFGFILLPGLLFYWAISSKKNNFKPIKLTPKWLIILMVAWIFLIIVISFHVGYDTASNQKRFRITKDNYAIVYENDEYYFLSKYDPNKNELHKEQQKVVLKNGVEYEWKE